jgi:hypothetical protein
MDLLGTLATAGQLLMKMAFRDADTGALSMLGIALIVGISIAAAMRRKSGEGPLV